MPKANALETPAELTRVRAIHTISDGNGTHPPGTVFELPGADAELLIKAGAVVLSTDGVTVPIEDILPVGLDPAIWMADPRAKVNGQRSASFVHRAEYEAAYKARTQY